MFHINFSRKSIKNSHRYVKRSQIHAHPRQHINKAEFHKWVCHIFKNTRSTCLIFNFSREIDWEWSQICQRPPKSCLLTSTTSTRLNPTGHKLSSHILKNKHGKCFISVFSKKINKNGLKYVKA